MKALLITSSHSPTLTDGNQKSGPYPFQLTETPLVHIINPATIRLLLTEKKKKPISRAAPAETRLEDEDATITRYIRRNDHAFPFRRIHGGTYPRET
ncbi:hypothetical protein PSTG_05259 [Puccinia striiformis f. sp. tritici PST-78]|uniref:Uncharacterized protein n=1 Tax=Puccinia striiformis f. sp. tritici PST-78 TaxID=1165861 RepID=A0A0L0VQL0_9BASI|nr:hypothetical protein PSTG_05259 [Puccinia striiformis f. sp. tritici PST-78]